MLIRRVAAMWLLLCSASGLHAEKFTVAVIPDTQSYVDQFVRQPQSGQLFNDQMAWLASQKASKNIVFTAGVGDIAQRGDDYNDEWVRAAQGYGRLADAGMAFGVVPGNHDYDNMTARNYNGLTKYNEYFGANSQLFAGKSWYGGSYTDPGPTAASAANAGGSSYQIFSGGGRQYLHIGLDMESNNANLAWAQSVLDSHPNMPAIVTTHIYLRWYNDSVTEPSGPRRRDDNFRTTIDPTRNNAQALWNKFLSVNDDQVFMVLSGHNFYGQWNTQTRRIDPGVNGNNILQLQADFQAVPSYNADGVIIPDLGKGGGWVRLMEFDTEANQLHVRTYSTVLGMYSTDPALTDGSTFARTWASFNYKSEWHDVPGNAPNTAFARAQGPLVAAESNYSADFILALPTQAVPEPASVSLMALGAALVLVGPRLLRRRHPATLVG